MTRAQLTYFSESAFETYELTKYAESAFSQSNFAIFGTHGPITKNKIEPEGFENVQTLICADPTILSFVTTGNDFSGNIISNIIGYRIILSKTKIR